MAIPSLVELADSGAHFGHNRALIHPKAKHLIFSIKNNVALINLEKTIEGIELANKMLREAIEQKKTILLVGTKSSTRLIVEEIATAHAVPFIAERWFGGTLTNFETIIGNIRKMNELELFLANDKSAKMSKKERLLKEHRLVRYKRFLGGLSSLTKMPELIIFATASADRVAINEANQLAIPTIAITDTDFDPRQVTVAVPGNDDAPKAINLILNAIFASEKSPSQTVTKESADEEEKSKKKKAVKKTTETKKGE